MNVQDVRTPTRAKRSPRTDKAEARHRALLDAALEIIGREGIDAVSHRRVAELAKVPLGSTTYYFASREDMLVQALEYYARGEIAELKRVFEDPATGDLIDRLIAMAVPQLGEGRWRALAQYALFQESARREELRPIVQEWNQAWLEVLSAALAALGRRGDEVEARMALGMLDGLLLAGLALPQERYVEDVFRPALERWLSA
jgi:TetR/AcrR family transcriptional regulator, regulator of biofilm formation and stress response